MFLACLWSERVAAVLVATGSKIGVVSDAIPDSCAVEKERSAFRPRAHSLPNSNLVSALHSHDLSGIKLST